MKNSVKKLLLLVMAVALVFSAVGCGGGESGETAEESAKSDSKYDGIFEDWDVEQVATWPVEGEPTFTYWVRNDQSSVVTNYAELDVYKHLKEVTGVNIEFIHPSGDQNNLEMMIAAGTLPDMIETVNMNSIPTGADQAIEDGVILRLNDLVEQFAPNFMWARGLSDNARRLTMTDQGNIYGFPKLIGGIEYSWGGPSVRTDLLESLNLDVPETFDDWYDMLTAFKAAGIDYPMTFGWSGWNTTREYNVFVGGFDVGMGFYRKSDGKTISFGPVDDGYFRFVSTFHKWYEEGLIPADFDSLGRGDKATLASEGKIGAAVDIGFGTYKTTPVPYPVENRGDFARFRQTNWSNRGYEATITTACSDPELAVKWFDYHYSPDGSYLFSFGVEGETYNYVDGEYIYTPNVINEDGTLNMQGKRLVNAPFVTNPLTSGLQMPVELREEKVVNNAWRYGGPDGGDTEEDFAKYYTDSISGMIPTLTMTTAEREEFNSIMDVVNAYVNPKFIEFIKGEYSLDQWDEYVKNVKDMGIDRAIEIEQAAYDRFLSR